MITTAKQSSILQGFPKYRSMLAGNAAYIPNSFESIATVTGNGSATTLTFSSIPQTYTHLILRGRVRTSPGGDTVQIQLNSQTSGYASHRLTGNGTSAAGGQTTAAPGIYVAGLANTGTSSSYDDVFIATILNYASSTQTKTIRTFCGSDRNSTDGVVMMSNGLYNATTAVTSITIAAGSYALTSSSTIALYGIKDS